MKRLVNGKLVDLTPEEIAARQAEEKAWLDEKPLRDWRAEIAATDAKLTRAMEDIIDVLTDTQRTNLADETRGAYLAKKEIRSRKPTK